MNDPLQRYESHPSSPSIRLDSSQSLSTGIYAHHDEAHRSRSEERLEHLKSQLSATKKQLRDQELQTQEAKKELLELTMILKEVNNKRVAAVGEAQKANEELRLYKIQLQHAQQVISNAQGLLDSVDRERYQAEREAAKTKTALRRLNREVVLRQAMEEGRRIGLREGFERGQELEFLESESVDDSNSADEDAERNGVEYRPRSLLVASPLPSSDPVPIPPLEAPPVSHSRPRSFHSPSPSVYRGGVSIPPEGYIPALDSDHVIRIPPPHEFSRPPPTPERTASPPLPAVSQGDDLSIPTRPRSDRSVRSSHQRDPSLGSVSTSLSQLELVNGPGLGNPSGRRSPLSVIPEVPSVHSGSPNPPSHVAPGLNHKPSWTGSHQSNRSEFPPDQSRAGSVRSADPGVREYFTPTSTRPPSALLQPHGRAGSAHTLEQAPTQEASPANSQVPLPIPAPMPGAYHRQTYRTSSPSANAQHLDEQGDNASVSSGMSNDTLTTPVLGRRHHF